LNSIERTNFDYPGDVPPEFYPLLAIGKKTIDVEAFGWKWKIATLEEWEERIIEKRHRNYGMISKERVERTDILTQAIIEATNPDGTEFKFEDEGEKVMLRCVLLYLDSKPLNVLYNAYLHIRDLAKEEFEKKYPKIHEEILEQIFEQKEMNDADKKSASDKS